MNMKSRRTLQEWLAEYGESHTHPTNIMIHKFCVPLIMLSILGLLWSLPVPALFASIPLLNWATLFIFLCLLFYSRLSLPLTLGMVIESALMILFLLAWDRWGEIPLWSLSLGIFVVAWIFQFIGHKIEGKKPSFFKDLQFLLIGPLWTLRFLYHSLGLKY